jgi:sulfite exporter TauE/SafE
MVGLGVVASLSSCLASTGGYLLAVGSRNPSKSKTLAIHAGRLAAFAVGGAALGAIGGSLPAISPAWVGILALVLGVGFLLVGLNLLELAPSLARLGIALPSGLHRFGDRVAASKSGFAPFLVGAVTFVLPCGFTQTAQALALASGSAGRGFLLLVAFSLGTLPVLLGITWFGTAATLRHRMVRLVAGSVLVLFAFSQIDGGLTVLGSPVTVSTAVAALRPTPAAIAPVPVGGEQVIRMTVANGTFQPNALTVKNGTPVQWDIDGKDISGCANSIVVPSYGISVKLAQGPNVIRFTPKGPGTIPFSCGMGMIRGTITVI